MPNFALLKQTLAHIEANPEQWEQGEWRTETECGTAYCFAGWAAVLSGADFYRDANHRVIPSLVVLPGEMLPRRTGVYAAEVLGLDDEDDEGIPLFAADNTLSDLRRIVGELCEDGADHG